MGYPVVSRISTLKKSGLEESDTIRGCVCKVKHANILTTVTKARPMTEQSLASPARASFPCNYTRRNTTITQIIHSHEA